ncbi:MAG: hypothetical protein DMG58_13165 [Acidobacteria bacterium]|nr:MAG: hypothetical protein DMG58_13165 [Acidobacteriota bacterium]
MEQTWGRIWSKAHTGDKVAPFPSRRDPMRAILLVLLCTLLLGCRTNESPEGQVDDLQITAQVKSKLASDIGISSVTNISVNSTNGVVTLAGQVNSPEVRTKAEGVAKSVPKVVSVVDTLQVTPKERLNSH